VKKFLLGALISSLSLLLIAPTVNASPLSVKIECGYLENFEDEEGEYLLFNPTGKVSFAGNKINYRIYFSYKKNTPLSKQSYLNRVTSFGGTSQNQIDNFSMEHKFRDNIFDEKYYKSKYLEFTITAKVSKEPTVTSKCVYKRG
jgi:hypothetical protein